MKNDDDHFAIEEEFHRRFAKEGKKERKIAQRTDRSKQKLSNRNKMQSKPLAKEKLSRGTVLSIFRSEIHVFCDEKKYSCQLRGNIQEKKGSKKNLIAIGDHVLFSKEKLVIEKVLPRNSVLSRRENLGNKEQIIAANVDQLFIVTSVVSPNLKPNLIDRYLIAAKKGKMKPLVVINKIDLLQTKEEKALYKQFLQEYSAVGISIISTSTTTKKGLSRLKKVMKNQLNLFSGQSGVGKSSLINAVCNTELKTATIVKTTNKGAHATTHASLIPLKGGGFCIDTPGIKSFGLWELTKEDIIEHFSEIDHYRLGCFYSDCSHTNEPDCAVQEALEEKKISSLRFASYLSLIHSIENEHKNR